jgi:deazaflavin-dependent oxidoreductase (nitroreductase family)
LLSYVNPEASHGWVYRAFARFAGTRAMGWFSRNVFWKVDPVLLRLSGGRVGTGMLLPTALLETQGARTGQPRANAVIYFHDRDRVTIIASKLGLPHHPAWFHNLRANPDVRLGGEPFRAEVVEDSAERERLWTLADRVFPPYATYRRRAAAAGRQIPVVQLIPRD